MKKTKTFLPVSLMFGGTEMEKVEYLGLLLSSDMSFSKHFESICSKAWKITGLLYRRFCCHIAVVPDNDETTSRVCNFGIPPRVNK